MKTPALALFTLLFSSCNFNRADDAIDWTVGAILPNDSNENHIGVAGPIAGVIDYKLIIAGGANFPEGKPWEGGKKHYQKQLYVYDVKSDNTIVYESSQPFQDSVAYSVSISAGNQLYSLGGERNGVAISDVFSYSWKDNKLERSVLPSLPVSLTNGGGVKVGNSLYFVGGENQEIVSNKVYKLDLTTSQKWEEYVTLPYELTHMVVTASDNSESLIISGGRKRNLNAKSDMYHQVMSLDTKSKKITDLASLPKSLAAGTGMLRDNKLIIIGGDDASVFHQVEELIAKINLATDEIEKKKLIDAKNDLQRSHPGFSKEVWVLDINKNTWKRLNDLKGESPVTTTLITHKNLLIIPSGEIKAGVRTNQILVGKYN